MRRTKGIKNYQTFLKDKSHSGNMFGFDFVYMPEYLYDFQKYLVEKGTIKGRMGIFADTGLGKTAIELVLAQNIVQKTNKRVLILTPLAVAFQFILEAEKIGIESVEHSKNGKFKSDIVITNYERLHYFESKDFVGVILDESSILKNFDGITRASITNFMRKTKYRFLGTATPSPNDFIELGTSSEALGYLGYTDMLSRFFSNKENTIRPQNIGTKWYLKPHATNDFFKWISSWSISLRTPSDLGFSDDKYILPELIKNYHSVKNKNNFLRGRQRMIFANSAKGMVEVRVEQKATIKKRCKKAVELSQNEDVSVYWCNLNAEGDLLEKLDPDAYQIKGGMDIDKKEELLIAFSKGEINKIITKAKITAFGLNWQHCNHLTFFPTWSYEQYYQAVRRFWRFGQTNPVTVDIIHSDGQERVLSSLESKSQKAIELFAKMNTMLNSDYKQEILSELDKNIKIPNFLIP